MYKCTVLWKKKFSEIKSLMLGLKKSCGKVLEIKVCGNKVLPFWDLIFLGFFSGSSMILYKNVSGKKSSYGGKCMATMDVTTMEKRGLVLKTTLAILNMQMNRRKALLMNKSQTWPHFLKVQDFFLQIYFFKDFNSCDLISWDFIGSPPILF